MRLQTSLITSLAFLACLCLSISAPAQTETEEVNTWGQFNTFVRLSGNGFTKQQRANPLQGEILYTTSKTEQGVMFACIAGRFSVTAALEPRDFLGTYEKAKTGRSKSRFVDIRLDGGAKKPLGVWTYKPTLKIVSSRKSHQAAKLYNAAVRRQTVTIHYGGTPITLNLPKPNRTFANFGADCGIGKLAKKK